MPSSPPSEVEVRILPPKAVGPALPHRCTRPGATCSEWNRLYRVIKRLYIDEDRTLEEVMTIMKRDYGHRANMRTYKRHLANWGLDKKSKGPEAWALLRLKLQRDAVGKDSAFRIRGQSVTIDDVLRYFRRKGILQPELQASHRARSPEPSIRDVIEVWTPAPSPEPELSNDQSSEEEADFSYTKANDSSGTDIDCTSHGSESSVEDQEHMTGHLTEFEIRQILFSSPNVQSFDMPHSPKPPESLFTSEQFFATIKGYYTSAFATGQFQTSPEGLLENTHKTPWDRHLYDFHQLCNTGMGLILANSVVEGRRCFSRASALVGTLLRSQHPQTLLYIIDVFIFLGRYGLTDIGLILRNLMSAMAIKLFPPHHPWAQLFFALGKLDAAQFVLALIEAWRCMCDIFAQSIGQFHGTTLRCYAGYLGEAYRSNCVPQLRSLLLQGEQELEPLDLRLLGIKLDYGFALYTERKHALAIETLEELLVSCDELRDQGKLKVSVLRLLSFNHQIIDDRFMAESRLREAIRVETARAGGSDTNVMQLKALLEEWLRGWGREAEAAYLMEEVDEMLGPDDINLELDEMLSPDGKCPRG